MASFKWPASGSSGPSGSGATGQVAVWSSSTVLGGSSALTFSGGILTVTSSVTTGSLISSASNPASAGVLRLANTELIASRNAGNSADVTLGVTASNIWQASSGIQLSANSSVSLTSASTNLISSGGLYIGTSSGALLTNSSTALLLGAGLMVSNNTSANITSSTTDIIVSGGLRFVNAGGVQITTSSTNLVIGGNCYINTTSGPLLINSSGSLRVDGGFRVGGSVETSALLEISSTSKGALFPRMTSTQRNAITSPASGLMIWDTDGSGTLDVYAFSQWLSLMYSPTSSTDNAITRFDSTLGQVQNSSLILGDLTANKIIVNTPSAATTPTAIEFAGGACSTASTAGGNLILRGGAGGSGADRGSIVIGGTANTTGNRGCLVSETDGVGEWGYDYAAGGYRRARAFYVKSSIQMRNSGSSGSGIIADQDGTTAQLTFYRSTANSGMQLQNLYHSVIGVYNEAGTLAFNFGRWDGTGSNFGEFWLMKSSGASVLWNTDQAGDVGASGASRPRDIFAGRHLNFDGALQGSITTTATSYTTVATDFIVAVTSTASARTITLVSAATMGAGAILIVKDQSGGAATNNITVSSGDNIDGAGSATINANYGVIRLYCTGSTWYSF